MKHLIQGRNNETRLGVESLTFRSWSSKKRCSKPLRHTADKSGVEIVKPYQRQTPPMAYLEANKAIFLSKIGLYIIFNFEHFSAALFDSRTISLRSLRVGGDSAPYFFRQRSHEIS